MFHFFDIRHSSFRLSSWNWHSPQVSPAITVPFLLGIAAGSLIGVFSASPQELLSAVGVLSAIENGASFWKALWYASRFILLAALLSLGLPGIVLVPLLSALRGFSFACSVAVVLLPPTSLSLLLALLSFVLPSLISFPAFLLAETDAFLFSKSLIHRDFAARLREIPVSCHLLLIVLLCAADAVYIRFLLPLLRGFLI